MGSSMSAISDDYDYYDYLCKKYNEIEQKLYSDHYNWLEERDKGKTKLSYEEYKDIQDKRRLTNEIASLERDIERKKKELAEAKKKLYK